MRLTSEQALERFRGARVVRFATVDDTGAPHLVPITFAVVDDGAAVVFAVDHKPKTTTQLRRLTNLRANSAVCLLADGWSEDWSQLWWARADGSAVVLSDSGAAAAAGRAALVERYPQYRKTVPAGPVVRIAVRRWSGWSGHE